MMENKNVDIKFLNENSEESAFIDMLMLEVNKVIVGQKYDSTATYWTSWERTYFTWVFLVLKTLQ